MIFLYILIKPVYLWDSGLPQISDILLVLLIVFFFIKMKFFEKFHIPYPKFTLVAILFLFYVIFINSIWYMVLGNESILLKNSLFYIYNIMVMLVIIILYHKNVNNFLTTIYYGVVTSVFIQVIFYFLLTRDGIRTTLLFNNPNQLAYYALLCLAYLFIIERNIKVRTPVFMSAILGSVFLIITTASLGAVSGAIVLYVFYIITSKKKGLLGLINWLTVVISSIVFYIILSNNPFENNKFEILDVVIKRLQTSNLYGEGFILERAYDRILHHPEYWLFGAGEGVYERFNSLASHEIHSTLGNIFFSYGFIGFLLFITLLLIIFLKNKWIYAYPIIGIMIYGLTHNGIRQSMMWIMFAMLLIVTSEVDKCKVDFKMK